MASVTQQNRAVSQAGDQRRSKLLGRFKRGLIHFHLFLCVMLVHALIPKFALGQQDSAGEYELKAAMLYNLTRFVEWPPSAYPDPQAPTVLCIMGRDPFGRSLTSIIGEQVANGGRAVEVRHVQNDKGLRGCQVVYISSSERKNIVQILSTLKGSSVLTVGEMAQFAARGGMIQFSLENQQVRFEINLDAASRVELKISSRLLVLARIVRDESKNPGREGSALRSQAFEVAFARRAEGHSEPGQDIKEIEIVSNVGAQRRGSR